LIRVAFLLNFPVEYKGGINYLKNLFFALNKYYKQDVALILFVPRDLDEEYLTLFKERVRIVKTDLLKSKSLLWFLSRISERLLGLDPFMNALLKKYGVEIVSHSSYVFPGNGIKTVNWIPDFQHIHYPSLFSKKELSYIKKHNQRLISQSDLIVLSSLDSLKDYKTLYNEFVDKVRVLRFVSQPELASITDIDVSKYVNGRYFYMPNQFWKHKNHIVVFRAIKVLKDQGIDCRLITSGLMHDYRDKIGVVSQLKDFVADNDLVENVSFLGLIPYEDVLRLILGSSAVINPSLFEGWSSTVEESKSIGKLVILSDIPVHREQNPANSYFFKPDDEHELARILLEVLSSELPIVRGVSEQAVVSLNDRTKDFADTYFSILRQAMI
jgi:glycosyltransferase involved in cell wall biosynthesis